MRPTPQLEKLIDGITQTALALAALGLALMTVIVAWQVFARYVLNASPAWSESAALLLMLYYILLAAAVGVHEGFHLGLKFLLDALPVRLRRLVLRINYGLVGLFGVLMMVNGARLAAYTADHVIPTLSISRSVAYWPFSAAGLMIAIFALYRLVFVQLSEEE